MKKIVLQKQPQVKLEEVNLNETESDSEQIIPFERKQIPQIAFNTKNWTVWIKNSKILKFVIIRLIFLMKLIKC